MTKKTNLQALGSTAELGALPCPFCGSTQIGFADGSTFRWLVAVCENCGAQAEEVRIDTLMPCRAAAEANAKVDALKAWNTRAPNDRVEGRDAALSRRVPSHDGLCGNGSEVGAGDTAMKGKQ